MAKWLGKIRSMRFRISGNVLSALLVGTIVGPVGAQVESAQITEAPQSMRLPAQALSKSLTDLGNQFSVTIVASGDGLAAVNAPEVAGTFTLDEALAIALSESGLRARRTASGAYVIEAAPTIQSDLSPEAGALAPTRPLEEILIFGQKRDQTLSDVNASVAVFTGEAISDLNLTDLTELYQFTPNVQATVSDEGDFAIRGINFRGQTGVSNVASIYVDGIFQSTLGIEAGPSAVFDVEQVEIYRGVQSTIQGRNALAGAVIVRTTRPTYEWDLRARTQFADYDTERYSLAGGGPIIADQLAFRLAWEDFSNDGYIENSAAGIDDINFDDTENRRARLLFEPAALEGFSALLTYVDSEGLAGTGFGTGSLAGPDFFDREIRPEITSPGVLVIDTKNWALELEQQVSEALSISFLATTSDAYEESAPRFDGGFDLDTAFDISTDEEITDTYELRGVWEGDSLRVIGGLYRFEQDRDRERNLGLVLSNFFFVEGVAQETENTAVYFDAEYGLSSRWTMLLGARYDRESYKQTGFSAGSNTGPVESGDLSINVSDTDFDAFLPKFGIRWDQTDDVSWSLVAQRGYRAGGAAIDVTNTPYEFDPEFTNNLELAFRSNFLDGKLSLNANLFYTRWNDQQVIVELAGSNGLASRIENAGESELYGLETDLTALLGEHFTLIAGFGLLHTEVIDFIDPVSGEDFGGNEFPQAPGENVSFALFYEHDNGLFGSIDGRYQGSSFSEPANVAEHRVDSYFVANAKFGYRTNRWSASLFVRNLFDEEYLLRIRNVAENPDQPLNWEANVGAPRVVGAELTLDL
ncbi:MAG: TonB-dependent receptor [Pseudomonadota bacterium]